SKRRRAFYLTNLSSFASTLDSIQCSINKTDIVLKIKNSTPHLISLKTSSNSEYNQKVNGGTTTLILNIKQFPAILEIHPNSEKWIISQICEIKKQS
ncbi:hypothetical protein BCT49_00385, partial [Vibrio lentus]